MGTNDLLKMKSITKHNKQGFGEVIGMYLSEAWYFDKWYEKMIIVCLGALGIWKIVEFFL